MSKEEVYQREHESLQKELQSIRAQAADRGYERTDYRSLDQRELMQLRLNALDHTASLSAIISRLSKTLEDAEMESVIFTKLRELRLLIKGRNAL